MRLFGFDSGVRQKLEESYESEGPVSVVLSNILRSKAWRADTGKLLKFVVAVCSFMDLICRY